MRIVLSFLILAISVCCSAALGFSLNASWVVQVVLAGLIGTVASGLICYVLFAPKKVVRPDEDDHE